MDVPVERVAAAVWLEEPKTLGKEEPAPVKEPSKDDEFAKSIATHWLVLQDGSRLGVKVDKFMADRIIAWSPSLGTVDVPNDQLAMVKLAAPSPTSAMLAYRDWQPEFAPEPVLPETGGIPAPTFLLFINHSRLLSRTYRRYLENLIRAQFPFPGLPLHLVLKSRQTDQEQR